MASLKWVLSFEWYFKSPLLPILPLSSNKIEEHRQNDYVAERWHGRRAWLPKQSMDEIDGHRAQGTPSHGQRNQSEWVKWKEFESVSRLLIKSSLQNEESIRSAIDGHSASILIRKTLFLLLFCVCFVRCLNCMQCLQIWFFIW